MVQRRIERSQMAQEDHEDEDSPRPKKRLRVSRACDQCRRRRDRCDGQQPSCRPCLNGNRTCTYNELIKKRGLPAGYVRAMETVLGLVFHYVDGSEELISSILNEEENLLVDSQLLKGNATLASSKSLLEAWRKSKVVKQMENLLCAESAEDDEAFMQRFDDRLTRVFSGFTGRVSPENREDRLHELSQSIIRPPAEPVVLSTETNVVSMLDIPQTQHSESNLLQLPAISPLDNTNNLRLPPHWSQLLDMYFSITHCWFPISQKHDLLRPAYMLANDSHGNHLDSGESAFLWAVLAFTSHQCSAAGIKFDSLSDAEQTNFSSKKLYSLALKLMPSDPPAYEIGHLRALLIHALLHMGRASWTSAWMLIGRSVYIAMDLKIITTQKSQSEARINLVDDGQRRAALGCFLLDTLVSARLERRPYLRRSDLSLIGLMQVDSNEEWESEPLNNHLDRSGLMEGAIQRKRPGRILSTYNIFLNLISLLNDIVCQTDDNQSEGMLWAVSQDLESWRNQLPSHSRVSSSLHLDTMSTHLLNLELAYVSVAEMLKVKASGLSPASIHPMPPDLNSSRHQIVSLIAQQKEKIGQIMLTPVFEIYLWICGKSVALQKDLSVSTETSNISNQIHQLIEETKDFWQGPQLPQFNILQPLPLIQVPSKETSPQAVNGFSDSSLASRLPLANSTINRQSEHQNQVESMDAFSGTTVITPMFTQNSGFPSVMDPLTSEPEEDALFRRLAMLDPVDWTVNQPEFMSHLGFMPEVNVNQVDFQSYFGR